MKYLKKRRFSEHGGYGTQRFSDEDPMNGVANLFDITIVFIVGLILMLFSTYHMQELFTESSKVTILKQSQNGEMEIITKEGKKVKIMEVKKDKAKGMGVRLGVAYRLGDGATVYVPE